MLSTHLAQSAQFYLPLQTRILSIHLFERASLVFQNSCPVFQTIKPFHIPACFHLLCRHNFYSRLLMNSGVASMEGSPPRAILAEELTGTGDFDNMHLMEDVQALYTSCCSEPVTGNSVKLRTTPHNLEPEFIQSKPQQLIGDGDVRLSSSSSRTNRRPGENGLPRRTGNSALAFILSIALMFRIVLLVFSVWQDETRWPDGQLRFTDVDYDVFTDAAKALVSGEDIYHARPTYRYSPLIAALLAPGHWLFSSPAGKVGCHTLAKVWGKGIFIISDLLCAWLQYQIITVESKIHNSALDSSTSSDPNRLALHLISFGWLFNPVTAVVSVRGNAEAVLGMCVLGCLWLMLTRRLLTAGLLFGLCVHLKLYPVIYAPAIYLWLTNQSGQPLRSRSFRAYLLTLLPSSAHFRFGLATSFSLGSLTAASYVWFGGWRFLHQAYLYHFTRVDIKHNFAPHFYPLYLLSGLRWQVDQLLAMTDDMGSWTLFQSGLMGKLFDRLRTSMIGFAIGDTSKSAGLLEWLRSQAILNARLVEHLFSTFALLPSVVLILAFALKLHRQPSLCWFAITYAFVTFNKVCTSQYFLWSLVLLPPALANLRLPAKKNVTRAVCENLFVWYGAQVLWLATAYTLELRTPSSAWMARYAWLLVWSASGLFFICNIWLLRRLLRWRKLNTYSPTASTSDTITLSGDVTEDKKTK
ncbi:GPI mannosyltransferase 1 [Paragonimus heterotremus]|uniref:GPI alpha-1,4-mannosyltransferase I, catalytic subunit n=1 Tax=Paragonimus heterotremus TaxID=100268 RepID=A0A8J4T642_9TREM|nr:GPI mannosyltransferase 1 [Paragonimus heterotremus]